MGALWAGSVKDACRGCHDEIVANRPDYLSWCSQWGIFDGTGGAETPEGDYGTSAHSTLEKGCVSCHMAQAPMGVDSNRVGGHTFRVKTKGDSPILFNPGAWLPCHGEMTLHLVRAGRGPGDHGRSGRAASPETRPFRFHPVRAALPFRSKSDRGPAASLL